MISCKDVMERLWDYLDGELPPEQMQALADHLAECRRCFPQYRFEFVFLEALARQRARTPGPSEALVERVRLLISH
jgi:anti-sigma factor (TIGR02949 family)